MPTKIAGRLPGQLNRRGCHAEILRGDGEWWRAFVFAKVGNNGNVLGLGPRRVI